MPLVPLFPLPMVAFPGESIALHIFEPRYKDMVATCLAEDRPFCIVSVEKNQIARVGTLVKIEDVMQVYEDGKSDLQCRALSRVEILRVISKKSYHEGEIIPFDDAASKSSDDVEALRASISGLYHDLMEMASREAGHEAPAEPTESFGYAQYVGFDLAKKQEILELRSENQRLEAILAHLTEVVPKIKAYEAVKNRIIANGHFRQFPPIDINL